MKWLKYIKGFSMASFSPHITKETDQNFCLHFYWCNFIPDAYAHGYSHLQHCNSAERQRLVPCEPESTCFPENRSRRHWKSGLSHDPTCNYWQDGSLQPLISKHFECLQPLRQIYIELSQPHQKRRWLLICILYCKGKDICSLDKNWWEPQTCPDRKRRGKPLQSYCSLLRM